MASAANCLFQASNPAAELPHARHAYLPFGAGPRICLGTHLGSLQLVLATAWMVHRYEFDVTRAPDPDATPQALLKPEGLRVRFVARGA